MITVECHRVSNIMSWGNWVLVVTTRGQYGYLRNAIVLLFPVRRFQGPCSLYVVTIGGVNSSPGHLIHQKETCNPTMQQWRAETLPGFGSQSRRALAGACRVFSRKSTTTFQFAGALVGRRRWFDEYFNEIKILAGFHLSGSEKRSWTERLCWPLTVWKQTNSRLIDSFQQVRVQSESFRVLLILFFRFQWRNALHLSFCLCLSTLLLIFFPPHI